MSKLNSSDISKAAGFNHLRDEVDKLSQTEGDDFKTNLQFILKNMLNILETITTEFKSGQETSAKAFQAIAIALKTLTQKTTLHAIS